MTVAIVVVLGVLAIGALPWVLIWILDRHPSRAWRISQLEVLRGEAERRGDVAEADQVEAKLRDLRGEERPARWS